MKENTQQIGEFGPIYTQFENKPKDAIKHLMKVKTGDCINAYHHEEIGWIDITPSGYFLKTNIFALLFRCLLTNIRLK